MIKEHMLLVLEDNEKEPYLRKITVHPNVDLSALGSMKRAMMNK